MGTSAPTRADRLWQVFEAACREVGITPTRTEDAADGSFTYSLRVGDAIPARRAVALAAKADGIRTICCFTHRHHDNYHQCALVPVDDVIADPMTECAA